MQIYKINFNKPLNGFYPRYGASSIPKHTNLYKNGKTKGANKIENKLEKQVKCSVMLKNTKARKGKGPTILYA